MNTGSSYNKSFSTDHAFHGHNGNNWITAAGN
jgi:hypothetical protein